MIIPKRNTTISSAHLTTNAVVLEHERDDPLEYFHSGKAPLTAYSRDGISECALTGYESMKSAFTVALPRQEGIYPHITVFLSTPVGLSSVVQKLQVQNQMSIS